MKRAETLISIFLLALFIITYSHTSSLSVSWKNFSEDSGDLLTAAYILGIPHPTGYPLFVLLGRVFSLTMPGSLAFRITLVSLFSCCLAAVFLFLSLARLFRSGIGLASAAFASLALGFSLYFWSEAVVAEVYALNVLFLSLSAYFLIRWTYPDRPDSRPSAYLLLSAYLLGLSFANHMLSVVALLFAGILVLAGPGRQRLSLAVFLAAAGFFVLPLTLYAYLPVRSLRNPELDWGNPETWHQFKWLVTGEQYRFRFMAQPLSQAISRLWPGPFLAAGWPVLFLSTVGVFSRKLGGALRAALIAVIAADLLTILLYDIPDFPTYFLPASYALCFLAGAGFELVTRSASSAAGRVKMLAEASRGKMRVAGTAGLAGALMMVSILPVALHNGNKTDASKDLHPYIFGRAAFRIVEPNALIISEYDGRTFALWFFGQTEFKKSHEDCVVVLKYLFVWPWYVDNLKKLHPDLSLSQAGPMDEVMLELVSSNIEKRPIYTVREDPTLTPFYNLRPILGGETELFKVEKAERPR